MSFKDFISEGIDPNDLKVGDIILDNKKGKKGRWKVTHLNAHKGNTGVPIKFLAVKYREADDTWATVHKPIPYKFASKEK